MHTVDSLNLSAKNPKSHVSQLYFHRFLNSSSLSVIINLILATAQMVKNLGMYCFSHPPYLILPLIASFEITSSFQQGQNLSKTVKDRDFCNNPRK